MNNSNISRNLIWKVLAAVIIVLLLTLPSYVAEYKILLMTNILMYIILALSWTIFSGPTGYISLATAAFFGIGVYTTAILGNSLPLFAVVIIAGVISFITALLVGGLTLRLKGIYFTIFTFGLVELLKHFILWWEINMMGTRGRFVIVVGSRKVYYYMSVIFLLLLLISYLINKSKIGLALRSIGEQEEAAAHIGINVTVLKVGMFALSAFFMSMVGGIIATKWTYIDPYIAFNSNYSFMPVVMAIFGGTSNLLGPVIGGGFFAYLEELLITNFPYCYMIIFGSIMVITILYLPHGLIGLFKSVHKRFFGGEN